MTIWMRYTKVFCFILLIWNFMNVFASTIVNLDSMSLDFPSDNGNSSDLRLVINLSYTPHSVMSIKMDLTSVFDKSGFLKDNTNSMNTDLCVYHNDDSTGRHYLSVKISNTLSNEDKITCRFPVVLTNIYAYTRHFDFSIDGYDVQNIYFQPIPHTYSFQDFLRHLIAKSIPLLPRFNPHTSIVYDTDNVNVLGSGETVYSGLLTTKFSMLSATANVFAYDAKISVDLGIELPNHSLEKCKWGCVYGTLGNIDISYSSPPSIDIKGVPFLLGDLHITGPCSIECKVSTSTPYPILSSENNYSLSFTFPIPIGNTSDRKFIVNPLLPYAKLSVSDVSIDSSDNNSKSYTATINTNLNQVIYLRNIVNYYTGVKKANLFSVVEPRYNDLVSLTEDGLSLKIDLTYIDLTLFEQYPLSIQVNVNDYDGYLISPFLSIDNNHSSVIQSMIDFQNVEGTGIKSPILYVEVATISNKGVYLIININIAHYVYNLQLPKYMTVRSSTNEQFLYYSIEDAQPDSVDFGVIGENREEGNNYILTLFNQQTEGSYPPFVTVDLSSNNQNFVMIPISIDMTDFPNVITNHPMYFSFRNPILPSAPVISTRKILLNINNSITGLLTDQQFPPVKEGEHIDIKSNMLLNCDMASLNIEVHLSFGPFFEITRCVLNDNTLEYTTGGLKPTLDYTLVSFNSKSYSQDACPSSTDGNREYIVYFSCTVLRKYDSLSHSSHTSDFSMLFYSNLSLVPKTFQSSIPLHNEIKPPIIIAIDEEKSYSSMYYESTIISLPKFNLPNDNEASVSVPIVQPMSSQTILHNTVIGRGSGNDSGNGDFLGFYRLVFKLPGTYHLKVSNVDDFGFYSEFLGDSDFTKNIVKGTCDFQLNESPEKDTTYIIKVSIIGMCQFNYNVNSNTDSQYISLWYIQNELTKVWSKTTLNLSSHKPTLTFSPLDVPLVRDIVHSDGDTSRHDVLSDPRVSTVIRTTGRASDMDIIADNNTHKYKLTYTYLSASVLSEEEYRLRINIEHASVDSLEIDTTLCNQFELESPNTSSKEIVFVMKKANNTSNPEDMNTCEIIISQKTYTVKTQSVKLVMESPNIKIADSSNKVENSNLIDFFIIDQPNANYTTRRVNFDIQVSVLNGGESSFGTKYYIVYTDNFMSKPKSCVYNDSDSSDKTNNPIKVKTLGSYVAIGPLSQKSSITRTIQCELDINVKYVNPADSSAYLMFDIDYDIFSQLVQSDNAIEDVVKKLVVDKKEFYVSPNTDSNAVTTISSQVVSVLSWTHKGKDSINKQIDDAKQLVADSAKTTKDKVFVIELTYSNSTQTAPYSTLSDFYTLSTSGSVQAKFGIQGNQFNQQDLENALNNAIGNNPNLNDLSTSVIIDDIIQQCLAADLGCGALCAPCTGNESCLSDFDCLSGICSFGKCSKLDSNTGSDNSAFDSIVARKSYCMMVMLITVYILF